MSDIRYFPVSPIGEIYGKITNNSIIGTLAAVDGANDEKKPTPEKWSIETIIANWDDKSSSYNTDIVFHKTDAQLKHFYFTFNNKNYSGKLECDGDCKLSSGKPKRLNLYGSDWIIPKEQENKTYSFGNVQINNVDYGQIDFTIETSEPIKEAGENEVILDDNELQIVFSKPLEYESGHNIYYHCQYEYGEPKTGYIDGFRGTNDKLYIPNDGYTHGNIYITIYFPDIEHSIREYEGEWGNCQALKSLYEWGFYPYSKVITIYKE